jgi:hypothetical protein
VYRSASLSRVRLVMWLRRRERVGRISDEMVSVAGGDDGVDGVVDAGGSFDEREGCTMLARSAFSWASSAYHQLRLGAPGTALTASSSRSRVTWARRRESKSSVGGEGGESGCQRAMLDDEVKPTHPPIQPHCVRPCRARGSELQAKCWRKMDGGDGNRACRVSHISRGGRDDRPPL